MSGNCCAYSLNQEVLASYGLTMPDLGPMRTKLSPAAK